MECSSIGENSDRAGAHLCCTVTEHPAVKEFFAALVFLKIMEVICNASGQIQSCCPTFEGRERAHVTQHV